MTSAPEQATTEQATREETSVLEATWAIRFMTTYHSKKRAANCATYSPFVSNLYAECEPTFWGRSGPQSLCSQPERTPIFKRRVRFSKPMGAQ